MTLFLSKDFYTNDKECLVLAALNGLYANKHEMLFTCVDEIGYFVVGRFLDPKKDKTIMRGIRQGLESLSARKIIEIIDLKRDMYVLSPKGLTIDTEKEKFLTVEQWEVQKIFQNAVKPFNLFDFFRKIVGTINTISKEYHMSQESMIMFSGGSKSTLNDYIRQLEELKLLYIYRPQRRRNDGTYRNINNVYGRYSDKESIISSARDYINTIDSVDCAADPSRRSTKLRYNHYIAGAKKYQDKPQEVERLYRDCINYNNTLKQGELLDLMVFPEYAKDNELMY